LDSANLPLFGRCPVKRRTTNNESAAKSRKLLALEPAYATAQAQSGESLLLMGQTLAALAAAEKEPDSASKLQALACIYWPLGRRRESDSALHALEQGFADRNAYEIATTHAYRGGGCRV
jgi:hypothetical protein